MDDIWTKVDKNQEVKPISDPDSPWTKINQGGGAQPQAQPMGLPQQGEIRQGPAFWKYKVSDIAREGLKGLGLVAGGAIGASATPAAGFAGAVPGAGLGYAIGNQAADIIDTGLGINRPAPLKQQAIRSAQDVMHGMTTEMGGQVAGAVANKAIDLATPLTNRLTDIFRSPVKRAKKQAGEILNKAYDTTSPKAQANLQKLDQLEQRAGAPLNMTQAQKIGSRQAGMFEQSLALKSDLADTLTEQDIATRQGALTRFLDTMGKGQAAPEQQPLEALGTKLHSSVKMAMDPALKRVNDAYKAVGNPPTPISNVKKAVEDMEAQKDTITQYPTKVIRAIKSIYRTKGAYAKGDSLYVGDTSAKKTVPFQQLVKIDKELTAAIDDVTRTATPNKTMARNLSKLQEALRSDMDSLSELKDATGTAYRNARQEYTAFANRFHSDRIAKLMNKGDEITGYNMPLEKMPALFQTVSGYRELANSIGKTEARDILREFYTNEMRGTGEAFDVKKAYGVLRKNREVLKVSGLYRDMMDILKGELPREFERQLATKRLEFGETEMPYFTANESRKLMKDYGGLMRAVYGPAPVRALKDYHEILTRQGWNKNQSYSGGAVTADKLKNDPMWFLSENEKVPTRFKRTLSLISDVIGSAAGGYAGIHMYGAMGGGAGAVAGLEASRAVRRGMEKMQLDQANHVLNFLREAVADPVKADMFMKIYRSKSDGEARRIAVKGLSKIMATGTAMKSGRKRDEGAAQNPK